MKRRVKRTEQSAVEELLKHYEQCGKFNTTTLMAKNSGLERYLRVHYEGLRGFCERHGISHILLDAKVTQWDDELVIKTIRELHETHRVPINQTFLSKNRYNGLYQWCSRYRGSYKEFCEANGLSDITRSNTLWNDGKVYRLIKEMYVKNKGMIYPELIKKEEKGAYNYVFEKYKGFEVFVDLFDLHEFIGISLDQLVPNYNDENVVRLLKEAYIRRGEIVTPKWLDENGYGGLHSYISKKGEGSFKSGVEALGVSEIANVAYNRWTLEEVLEIVNDMYDKKQSPIMHKDFAENDLRGIRGWIEHRYGNLKRFFEENDMSDKYVNMIDVGKDLWAYGIRFEKIVKEILDELYGDVIYDRWFEHLHARPDFIFGDTGVWADAKLSSHAYFTSETVDKYTAFEECKELQLIYLRGHEFKVDNPKVRLVSVDTYIPKLKLRGRFDLVDKISEIRSEVTNQEQETFQRASSN